MKTFYAIYTSQMSGQANTRHNRFPKATLRPIKTAQSLLAHGAGSALAGIGLLNLSLSDALGKNGGILALYHDQKTVLQEET